MPTTEIPVRRSAAATWLFATRLARREVRRRPGRTLLVALLVAIPVMAMATASVLYRTNNDDWSASFERRHGAADLGAFVGLDGDTLSRVRAELPVGARVVDAVVTWTGLVLADGTSRSDVWVQFTDLPLDDPVARGIVDIRSGRAPAASDEILLDGRTADRLDVGVGDTLDLLRPSGAWRVVGLGRLTDNHSQGLAVVHDFDRERIVPDRGSLQALVELPASTTQAEAMAIGQRIISDAGVWTENRWQQPPTSSTGEARVLAWGWVAGVLALAAVGIIIAAAFATSARRQLGTIGHLSANGAPAGLIRRTLALQGTWTGVLGVIAGLVFCAIGLVAFRPVAENIANRSLGSYRVVAIDLVVIAVTAIVAATVAAAVPARTAARVPVLSALAGRRPLGSPPRRLIPIGLALFVGGLGFLFVAATGASANDGGGSNSDLFAFVAVLGALGVVFGMCCSTPLVVAAVGRLGGSSASGTWRLAARSTARVRTRSSGVVTAVATAGAFAVAGVTIAAMSIDDSPAMSSLPRDVAVIQQWTSWPEPDADGLIDVPPLRPLALDAAMVDRIEALLPDARWETIRAAGIDPRPFDVDMGPQVPGREVEVRGYDAYVATIADPVVLELSSLSAADEALLDEADLVEVAPWYADDNGAPMAVGPVFADRLVYTDAEGDVEISRAIATSGRTAAGLFSLMSVERAEALGLDVVEVAVVLTNPTDLTGTERRELQAIVFEDDTGRTAFIEPGDRSGSVSVDESFGSGLSVETAWDVDPLPVALINAIIVAVAVLFTLFVVAIGLSLSASESRDERDVLVAIGAPPRTLSRVAGAKAFVLAGTGVLLAVPTGYLPTWVVYRTVDDQAVPVPWLAIALLVLVVPIAAGLAAWATSAAARRTRPVTMSTSFAD